MKPVSRALPEDGGVGGLGALDAEPAGRLRPVGIRDVAALARVSPATASRALNGDKTVHKLMRDRVFAAAERLSYRPNPLARNLRRQRTSAIGVVVAAIDILQTSTRYLTKIRQDAPAMTRFVVERTVSRLVGEADVSRDVVLEPAVLLG